jgi:hypothetical protein
MGISTSYGVSLVATTLISLKWVTVWERIVIDTECADERARPGILETLVNVFTSISLGSGNVNVVIRWEAIARGSFRAIAKVSAIGRVVFDASGPWDTDIRGSVALWLKLSGSVFGGVTKVVRLDGKRSASHHDGGSDHDGNTNNGRDLGDHLERFGNVSCFYMMNIKRYMGLESIRGAGMVSKEPQTYLVKTSEEGMLFLVGQNCLSKDS